MTKREFAARLLFWLLPWPISRALPRSLRIYYFGPAGGPPPGFYDYWGTPGEYWPDMYTPPPPDSFPDSPDGPSNPSDPYTPGPGPIPPWHGPGSIQVFDNTYWAAAGGLSWDAVNLYWSGNGVDVTLNDLGTWVSGFRASYMVFRYTGAGPIWIILWDTDGNKITHDASPASGKYMSLTFQGYDIDKITFDGAAIVLTDITFY